MASGKEPNPRAVRAIQLVLLVILSAFSLGIVVWIISLIRLSIELRDVPSASIGISIVAIPLFLLLLGVVNYVFWGIRAGREGK
ncbi:MAG: hypothetical protein ACE5LX_02610 [Nitrospinota bacterium]